MARRDDSAPLYALIANYGRSSLSVLAWLDAQAVRHVHVLVVETGWWDAAWDRHVQACDRWVHTLGYTPHRIQPAQLFEAMVLSRGSFPSATWQWCPGLLKGVPLLTWLDEQDPHAEWTVVLPASRYQSPRLSRMPEYLTASEHYGGRAVWCPAMAWSAQDSVTWSARTPWPDVPVRARECQPCVMDRACERHRLSPCVQQRVRSLEDRLSRRFFEEQGQSVPFDVCDADELAHPVSHIHELDMACGMPFGCGM